MPRGQAIWIVRLKADPTVIIGGWVIRKDVIRWFKQCGIALSTLELIRIKDDNPSFGMEVLSIGRIIRGTNGHT